MFTLTRALGAATAVTALTVMAATAIAPAVPARAATVITVGKNGSGEYSTVQAAINAVPAGGSAYVISIGAGTYNEVINVPASKPNLTLAGATGNAEDVVIAYGNAAWMTGPSGSQLGTEGSATATIAASNVTVKDLTIANTYNPSAYSQGYSQAVALNAEGDRMIFTGDRFLGLQDTLLAWQPTPSYRYRQLYENSFIEGNVDFIFGDADAVFYGDNIKLEDRGAAAGGTNGYMTASATDSANTYGFLIDDSTVSSTAANSTFYLGRPWHPYTGADPQIVIRNTYLPAQIKSQPWTTMSGYSFSPGRYYEYDNTGPGSGTGTGRPQLTDTQAASYTPQAYLAGPDGWNPLGSSANGNIVTVTNPGSQTGVVGTATSLQIHASDSASGQMLTYSASGLPAGLSISASSGLISGTPSSAGSSSVTVTAADGTGASGSARFTWTVDPVPTGGGCHVTYSTQSEWAGGFVAGVTIDNTGSSAISSWTLTFTFGGDQHITSGWNDGTISQSGENVTITNAAFNGSIPAGGSASLGFQGSWTASDAAPPSFSINGTTCG